MTLIKALEKANKVLLKKSNMPILAHVLLEPITGGIRISATDLESWYQAEVEGITINTACTLPGSQLLQIAKANKGIDTITWDANFATIGSIRIAGLPAEEYPRLPVFEPEKYKEVKFSGLAWVSKAMASNDIRSALNGIYLDTGEGNLVATDGHRLHLRPIRQVAGVKPSIIPAKAVNFLKTIKAESVLLPQYCKSCEGKGLKTFKQLTHIEKVELSKEFKDFAPSPGILSKHYYLMAPFNDVSGISKQYYQLDDTETEIVFQDFMQNINIEKYYTDYAIGIKCPDCKNRLDYCFHVSNGELFATQILEGKFPDYKQVYPRDYTNSLYVKKTEILAALEKVSAVMSKNMKTAIFSLNGACHLSAVNPDLGEVDAEFFGNFTGGYEGNSYKIGFCSDFLKDALDTEDIIFQFNSAVNPVLITHENAQQAVIMPIRL